MPQFHKLIITSLLCGGVLGCPSGEDTALPGRLDSGADSPADVRPDTTDATAAADTADGATADTADGSVADSADVSETIADATDGEAGDAADASDATDADAPAPYRHTITIDGTNDFTDAKEKLSTTSSGYDAWITWDASALYVAYSGADVGTGSATKWVFVYVDIDPGASTGSTTAEKYNTEAPKLPTGFAADYYFAFRTDAGFSQFKKYATGSWSTVTSSGVTSSKSGSFVEMMIPFTSLGGTPTKIGVVTFMMNEAAGIESTYAGLYSGSFTDGYDVAKPIANFLQGDLSSSLPPNDATNKKP